MNLPSSVMESGDHGGSQTQFTSTCGHAVERLEGGAGVAQDLLRERAAHGREGHVEDHLAVIGDVHAVQEAQVHDVDPELGVLHLLHRGADVVLGGHHASSRPSPLPPFPR